eukprot:SAG11_NODE_18861_length_479_cov_2.394737_1_plen_56_part_00
MYIIEQNGFWYDGWYYTTDYDEDGNVEYVGKKYYPYEHDPKTPPPSQKRVIIYKE